VDHIVRLLSPKAKNMGKFEIVQRKNGEFQFNLKADNGKVILTSEGYTSKVGCLNGIESVRKNALTQTSFERRVSANGKVYFNMVATNGQVIGTSEMYETVSGVDNGIESIMSNAPIALVYEMMTTMNNQ
jgi:uncharacterized protein